MTPDKIVIDVQKWVQNGFCIGYLDERPVFIHGALPGEKAQIRITKSVQSHSFALAEDILEASPLRIQSDCASFPHCGGCSFRHISYNDETAIKKDLLKEQQSLYECLNSSSYNFYEGGRNAYRNHVQIHVKNNTKGFYGLHSNDVIPIPEEGCRNLSKQLNDAILSQNLPDGDYRYREVCGKVISPDDSPDAEECLDFFWKKNIRWKFPFGGFFQQNKFLTKSWLSEIHSFLDGKNKNTAELFCGTGLLGAYLHPILGGYTGFENENASLKYARKNFKNLGLDGKFIRTDLYRNPPDLKDFSLVIANPPRAGLKNNVLASLAEWNGIIIYSSCNSHTMDRDLKYLMKNGYRCEKSAVFDFFPGTPHMEIVVKLVK